MTQHPSPGPLFERPKPASRPCKLCGRPIIWGRNPATGSKVPLDARACTVFRLEAAGGDGVPQVAQVDGVHINHFITCPHADRARAEQHRKRTAGRTTRR
ncbi:MAG TPA: hypothetical protein PLU35_14730 [Phycisphaerales bacterium]|nr:hypothetical protein [Phycisphaerales bacterium]